MPTASYYGGFLDVLWMPSVLLPLALMPGRLCSFHRLRGRERAFGRLKWFIRASRRSSASLQAQLHYAPRLGAAATSLKAQCNRNARSGALPAPSIKQSKSTALRVGATFTVGCARPAAPITQRIHPRSSGGQEFGECSRSCVGRSCRVAPAIPRPPAPNSTSFKGSAVGRHPCWEITLGLTLLRTGMPR